ncbi:Dynein light chain [Ptychographa xylographoides]|nr:Dynein light chain [Ptychographa xylographoides]
MATEKDKKKLDGTRPLFQHSPYDTAGLTFSAAQIKSADMSEDMQQEAVDVATEAMEKFSIEKDIAQYIKKEVGIPPSPSPSAGAYTVYGAEPS